MKTKAIYLVLFILLAYVIPLIWEPEYLFFWKTGMLCAFIFILIFTRPPLRVTGACKDQFTDRLSLALLFIAFLVSQAAIVFEWAYLSVKLSSYPASQCIIGFILMFSGILFRAWSVYSLGQLLASNDQSKPIQRIVTFGPFSLVRFPYYFGGYLAAVGSAMFMQVSYALILTMIILFLAYMYRISVEEKALIREFGDEYERYMSRTKKFLPFIY